MAAHLDSSGELTVPALPYADLRPQIQSGDLLFCSGNYLVSEAIRTVTRSPWSHVGIILRVDTLDRILLLESVEDVGVRLAPLSMYTNVYEDGKPYDGALVLARHAECSQAIVKGLASFGLDQLTKPYNLADAAAIVGRTLLGIGRMNPAEGFLCSELVAACFQAGGVPINPGPQQMITPEAVWLDPAIQPWARMAAL